MRKAFGSALALFALACATPASEPAKSEPAPTPSVTAQAPTPSDDPVAPAPSESVPAAETPTPASSDPCARACGRLRECTKNEKAVESCSSDCQKNLAPQPKAAEEFADCIADFGCKALGKSLQMNEGALGICRTSAQKKIIDPNGP